MQKHLRAYLEFNVEQPSLALAAFHQLKDEAVACGFVDIDRVDVSVNVVVSSLGKHDVERLKERLNGLFFAAVSRVEEKED
jgi:hypothetical protein